LVEAKGIRFPRVFSMNQIFSLNILIETLTMLK
jgi:hypothetical protein